MACAADGADDRHAGLSCLTPAQREQALARWRVLRPHLEDGCPLVRVAGEHGVPERTLRRPWLTLIEDDHSRRLPGTRSTWAPRRR
jgi:hypothetical protein